MRYFVRVLLRSKPQQDYHPMRESILVVGCHLHFTTA